MRILGISSGNKESGVAVVEDGRLRGALLQERVSRIRRDDSLPVDALHQLLATHRLTLDDFDAVAGNISESQLRNALGLPARAGARFPAQAGGPEQQGMHHLTHAAAAFWTSGLPQALVVTIDNSGDDDTAVAFLGQGRQLQRLTSLHRRPVPIGGVYEQATLQTGFGIGGEGRLMGLAAYGNVDAGWSQAALRVAQAEGDPWQNGVCSALLLDRDHPIQRVLRPAWLPWQQVHADFAASVQQALESTVVALLNALRSAHPGLPLCLGGGVALNCALVGAIARTGWFDHIWVPPSPADPGNAIGAALLWAVRAGEPLPPRMVDTGLGPQLVQSDIVDAVRACSDCHIAAIGRDSDSAYAAAAAADVAAGRVVAWMAGGSEFGPRALGHRSLVADPRHVRSADALNAAKLREPWRPVAPAVLAESAHAWLESAAESPFMLRAFRASGRMQAEAPAAVHKDGTARAQTVGHGNQPWRNLITAFEALTGVPMVLNTSLNQSGEPIVHSIADALSFCRRAGVDRLYVDGVAVHWNQVGKPVDGRPNKPSVAVAGDLCWSWLRALTEQTAVTVVSVDPPADPAIAEVVAPLPQAAAADITLAIGDAADRARATQRPGSIAIGPLSPWDGAVHPDATVVLLSSLRAGLQAVRRNLTPQRLGAPNQLTITMPHCAQPHDPAALHTDQTALHRQRWSEALALASWFQDQAPHLGTLAWEAPDRWRWQLPSGEGATLAIAGSGPLPVVRAVTPLGEVSCDETGRVTLRLKRNDQWHTRVADTESGMDALWRSLLVGRGTRAPWPEVPVVAAARAMDHALAQAAHAHWQPVVRHWQSGVPVRWGAPTLHQMLPEIDWLGPALLGDLLLRIASVASNLRQVCSFEHPAPMVWEAVQTIAEHLGLHTAALASTGPQRPLADTSCATVLVASTRAGLEQAVALHAQLGSRAGLPGTPPELALARLYGVPSCCAAAFVRYERAELSGVYLPAVTTATRGRVSPWTNRRLPGAPTLHVPCSWACSATERQARRAVAALLGLCTAEPAILALLQGNPGALLGQWRAGIEAWLGDGDSEAKTRAYMRPHTASLLMADWTRLVAFVDATVAQQGVSGAHAVWRVSGGRAVSSAQWLLAETPELAQWQQGFVSPLDRALRAGGSLELWTLDSGLGPTVVSISGQAAEGPPLLWIPFGAMLP